MNKRLKELRETLKLSQEELAAKLQLSRNYISLVENGQRTLSAQSVKVLCSLFNVNENWFKTGDGEMFNTYTKDEQIEAFIGNLLATEQDSFKKRLISGLAALDDDGWDLLERALNFLSQKKD